MKRLLFMGLGLVAWSCTAPSESAPEEETGLPNGCKSSA